LVNQYALLLQTPDTGTDGLVPFAQRHLQYTAGRGFYRYMEQRWGFKKAQAANYVAWVKHEIKMELVLLNPADGKPN
jgi:hypothetical protein